MNTSCIDLFRQVLMQALREHRVLFLIEGIVLILLGLPAILVPVIATIAIATLTGLLILISGVVGLATTVMGAMCGILVVPAAAVIGVAAGVLLLGGPILEDVPFTLLLVVFFNIEGLAWSGYALEHRKALAGPWTWMLVSGIVDMILGFMILCRLPGTAAWAFGLLVGISMLFSGSSMIAMAVHARGSISSAQRTT